MSKGIQHWVLDKWFVLLESIQAVSMLMDGRSLITDRCLQILHEPHVQKQTAQIQIHLQHNQLQTKTITKQNQLQNKTNYKQNQLQNTNNYQTLPITNCTCSNQSVNKSIQCFYQPQLRLKSNIVSSLAQFKQLLNYYCKCDISDLH
jgi:hypothetical protein